MLHYQGIEAGTLDVLKRLVELAELEPFALVGGTGLALQSGHRLSIDLDFFSSKDFDREELEAALENHFQMEVIGRASFTLNCRLDGIKVDFIRHRYPLIGNLVLEDGIKLWSIEDIAAAKISAITKRGAKKDFYDLVEILNYVPLESVLSLFEKKYPSAERFLALKSLTWFEDAEEEPDPVTLRPISWMEIKKVVLKAIQEL